MGATSEPRQTNEDRYRAVRWRRGARLGRSMGGALLLVPLEPRRRHRCLHRGPGQLSSHPVRQGAPCARGPLLGLRAGDRRARLSRWSRHAAAIGRRGGADLGSLGARPCQADDLRVHRRMGAGRRGSAGWPSGDHPLGRLRPAAGDRQLDRREARCPLRRRGRHHHRSGRVGRDRYGAPPDRSSPLRGPGAEIKRRIQYEPEPPV